nr:putative ribonuclease H-like domain-containing protein [Tanacetum cinerariifolium]
MMLYKDAKTLFAAIETRFSRNKATMKTQKTILKQLYKNFSATSTESLNSNFNRLQKIRNKSDLDSMNIDDLYNNFKIVKQEVKRTGCSNSSSQNMAFVSSPSPSSTNKVPTTYGVSTASTQSNTANTKVSTANLSDVTVYMAEDEVPTNMTLMEFSDSEVNAVKASACWVWRPTKPNGASIILKGIITLMYKTEFKEFNEGYVTFGGGANGGRITGKGTIHTTTKDETLGICKKFITEIENLVNKKVKVIKCDNETEVKNSVMSDFCAIKGIRREFSVAKTHQQNSVAERRNKTLIEAARTMLAYFKLPTTFLVEAVNTACYVQNRVLVVEPHNKTLYELFRDRTHALSFMKPFGCHVTILNILDHLVKFDGKSDERFFVGYSLNSKAFRVYNIRARKVEENLHIRFLEDKPSTNSNDFVGIEEHIGKGHSSKETGSRQDYIFMPLWKDGLLFDSSSKNTTNHEPQSSCDARNKDDNGINKDSGIDAHEKSANSINDVNTIRPSINTASTNFAIDLPKGKKAIGTKWVFRNKKDKRGIVIKNTARIEEEVYVCQPIGFEDPDYPDKVYKLVKALYGLHQAPRAWYETLAKYLLDNGFHKGKIDQTLLIKRQNGDILVVQVYIDDIIFGSTKKELCNEFERLMKDKFQMSYMGELTFFLQTASTLVYTKKLLVKDVDGDDIDVHLYRSIIGSLMYLTASRPDIIDSPFELVAYTDSDYVGASTAAANTLDTREVQITATIDKKIKLVSEGEGSTIPVESHHTPSDEAASTGVDVRHGGAATIVSSLDAGQVSEKIVKSTKARRRAKIIVSDDKDAVEDTSKQRRKIDTIDQDPDISLVQHDVEVQGRHEQEIKFETKEISTDKTLVYIRRSASKDKGKGIMIESRPEQTTAKLQQRQERVGYEAAIRLQKQLDEE